MKASNYFFCLFCMALLFATASPVFSQNQMNNSLAAASSLAGWQPADNWLQLFRQTFGGQADTHWMAELSLSGSFFDTRKSEGFIVLLPDFITSDAQLKAKLQYGIFEGRTTHLLPLEGARSYQENHHTAKFIGTLGGVPATLDITVIGQDEKYLTILGFSPGQELKSSFSFHFEKVSERLMNSPAWAAR